MRNQYILPILVSAAALAAAVRPAAAAVDVVTTTPELAAIAKEVGGPFVSVTSIAKPDQNYHQIEARPADVVKVARAEVFVRIGMDMDQWADALMQSARNPKVQPGGAGYVDAAKMIRKKEIPTDRITGASGDIHVHGNPHYWLDPANGKVIAYEIDLALRTIDPKNAGTYDARYKDFSTRIDQRLAGWQRELAPYRGKSIVAYHAEWVYFLDRFSLDAFGYLEPKPGIPPSGSHVNNLINGMKAAGVRAIVIPSIYSTRFADLAAKGSGGTVAVVPYSVGSQGTKDYIGYIDAIVDGFRSALSQGKARNAG